MRNDHGLLLRLLARSVSLVASISLTALLATGCQPVYPDISSQLSVTALGVDVTDGFYGEVTWLSDDEYAFTKGSDSNNPVSKSIVVVLDSDEGVLREIVLPPKAADCFNTWWSGGLSRLPNGNLGLVEYCATEPSGFRETLYQWESNTDKLSVLQTYPRPFAVGPYAFSSDMSRLVQTDAEGPALSEDLYQITSDGVFERLVPHFHRARSPSLSADNQTVAFFGTDSYPGGKSEDFTTWPQIEGLARYPYDLHFMDADGQNVRLVLPRVKDPGAVKWSPSDENLLAFRGSIGQQTGLWLYDRETKTLQLLWPSSALNFDWSPDGSKIVVLEYVNPNWESSEAKIIDVPP